MSRRENLGPSASLGLVVLGALVLGGCPASSDEVHPPNNQFFFPTGMAMTADQGWLFVANANSDLRYDSGSISAVNLQVVSNVATDWVDNEVIPNDCEIDNTFANTLVCNEANFLRSDATVRTGNFATEIGVQTLDDNRSRVFAAVRGDPSLTWMDFDPVAVNLDCGGSGSLPRCDNAHRLSRMRNSESIGTLAPEPFGLYVDSAGGYVVMTHLTQGAVSLADAPTNGDEPVLSDALGGVFEPDPVTRVRSALGAAARLPGGRIYVTSRSEDRVQIFTVLRLGDEFPALVPGEFFFLRGVEPSDNGRGIHFSDGGDVAYVVNRAPAMLHVLDTSMDLTGSPRNELTRAVEICSSASNLSVGDMGQGERVYVACFREGQVWAINPASGIIESIIDVGRGPQALVLSVDRKLLYVSNFLEDTIAVINLEPASRTENRVVLKLGRTRQSGGK